MEIKKWDIIYFNDKVVKEIVGNKTIFEDGSSLDIISKKTDKGIIISLNLKLIKDE